MSDQYVELLKKVDNLDRWALKGNGKSAEKRIAYLESREREMLNRDELTQLTKNTITEWWRERKDISIPLIVVAIGQVGVIVTMILTG